STSATWSRLTPLRVAMTWPSLCTSFGPRCLKTSTASSSPIDMSRMALRIKPSSLTAPHPLLHDVRDQPRLLLGELLDCPEVRLEARSRILGHGNHLRAGRRAGKLRLHAGWRRQSLHGRLDAAGGAQIAQHGAHDAEDDQQHQGDRKSTRLNSSHVKSS